MQQLAAPNQPSNPAFSYFKNIVTIYYVKNPFLHRVNVQWRTFTLRERCLFKNRQISVGITTLNFDIKHIGVHTF
jgi:hypothetical protein